MSDLRGAFFSELLKMAKKDNKIHLLVGDLGYSFMEKFQKELPEQFTNCGIAEMNMIGVGAGMAIAGKKPYIYSNALFILSRGHEFVRDDIAYNNLNVKLVGSGAAGFLGFSHNMKPDNEDELLIGHLPNIKIFKPQENKELIKALKTKGPVYIKV